MPAKTFKPFLFVLTVMAVVSLACLGGGGTPAPEPVLVVITEVPQQVEQPQEPAPTAPPIETEAPVEPEAPPASEALDFFTEEFDFDSGYWSYFTVTGSTEANESGLDLFTEDGYMVFDVSSKYLYTYVLYDPYNYKDVEVEARVENRGTNNNNISLICRYSDEGWYEFNIANNGLYNIYAATFNASGDVVYNFALADGGSNKIKSGKEINEYKIVCKERKLVMYINGFETRSLDDNKYVLRDGQVGISVSSFADLPVKVEVDWIKINQP
jgi:hypothetical protein